MEISSLSFSENSGIFIAPGTKNLILRDFRVGRIKVDRGCENLEFSGLEISSIRGGAAVSIDNSTNVKITDCRFSQSLVGLNVSRNFQVRFDDESPGETVGVILKNCEFPECQKNVVISVILEYQDDYPNDTIGRCNFDFASLLSSEVEISSCEVSLSGRFAKPQSFSSWPPPRGHLEISRRGKAGRKCRILIDDRFNYDEDARTGEKPGNFKKRKIDNDLELLGFDKLPGNEKEISRSFRKAALLHHPDKGQTDPEIFHKLTRAKNNLLARLKK